MKTKPSSTPKAKYVIELSELPAIVPPAARLKRLLKFALRATQFRCTGLRQVDGEAAECGSKDE